MIHIYDSQSGRASTQAGSEGLWTSRWSPDGRSLSALTVAGNQLVILDRMTGKKRPLDVYDVETSTWSPDSAFIHYHTVGRSRVLGRVRVADGGVEPIDDLMHRPFGATSWSSLAPDGSLLLLLQVGRPEMYALTLNRH